MLPIKFERPSVDEQCLRLAEHFLSAEPHTEDDVWSLADAIQKAVEDWTRDLSSGDDTDHGDMDGDAATALESVYGPND